MVVFRFWHRYIMQICMISELLKPCCCPSPLKLHCHLLLKLYAGAWFTDSVSLSCSSFFTSLYGFTRLHESLYESRSPWKALQLARSFRSKEKDVSLNISVFCMFLVCFTFEECAGILSKNVAQCDFWLIFTARLVTSWLFAMSARCRLQTCCRPSLAFWCARLGNVVICKALSEFVLPSWQSWLQGWRPKHHVVASRLFSTGFGCIQLEQFSYSFTIFYGLCIHVLLQWSNALQAVHAEAPVHHMQNCPAIQWFRSRSMGPPVRRSFLTWTRASRSYFLRKKKTSPLQEGSDWQRDVHSCFTYTWLAVETRMKIAQYTCKYAFEYAFVYSSWALSRNHGDVWSCDRPIWISRRCFVLCLGFWPPSFPALPVFRLLVSFVSLCLRGFVAVFVLCLFGDLSRSRREICSFMIVELALS